MNIKNNVASVIKEQLSYFPNYSNALSHYLHSVIAPCLNSTIHTGPADGHEHWNPNQRQGSYFCCLWVSWVESSSVAYFPISHWLRACDYEVTTSCQSLWMQEQMERSTQGLTGLAKMKQSSWTASHVLSAHCFFSFFSFFSPVPLMKHLRTWASEWCPNNN